MRSLLSEAGWSRVAGQYVDNMVVMGSAGSQYKIALSVQSRSSNVPGSKYMKRRLQLVMRPCLVGSTALVGFLDPEAGMEGLPSSSCSVTARPGNWRHH